MYTHMPLLLSLKESETLVYEVNVPTSYWYPINGNTLPFRKQFSKSFWLLDNWKKIDFFPRFKHLRIWLYCKYVWSIGML